MDNNYDNLKRLLDNFKTLGFWGRLFSWSKIKNQLIDASADIEKLLTNNDNLQSQNSTFEQSISTLTSDLSSANTTIGGQQTRINELTSDNKLFTEKNEQLIRENKKLSENEATKTCVYVTNPKFLKLRSLNRQRFALAISFD